MQMLTDGRITPVVAKTFPLPEVASAHRLLTSGATQGKIVLDMRS